MNQVFGVKSTGTTYFQGVCRPDAGPETTKTNRRKAVGFVVLSRFYGLVVTFTLTLIFEDSLPTEADSAVFVDV